MSNKKKTIEVVKKHDNSIEVAIRKNPAKTTFGKVAGAVVLVGFVLVPVIALVYALINMLTKL